MWVMLLVWMGWIFASLCVETGRWASERASPPAQAAGGPGAGVARGSGVWRLLLPLLLVHAQDVAVVAFSSARVGEDGVGFGDLGEAGGGVRVRLVDVWMGLAGEGVELSALREGFLLSVRILGGGRVTGMEGGVLNFFSSAWEQFWGSLRTS